jgi:RNA polymerase sigma-70 factor (ECF subfamily)
MSLTSVYEEMIARLYAFGSGFTNNRSLVGCCIHDVFLKLCEKEDLASVGNIKSYMMRSLKNQLLNDLARKQNENIDGIQVFFLQEKSDEDHFMDAERQQQINSYIGKVLDYLTARQREVITLYFLEQRSVDEISRLLGVNRQAVWNIIHRALKTLREKSGDRSPDFLHN